MAAESQEDVQPLIEKYLGKFPEIPEQILARIVREYGTDPDYCLRILEGESIKCLYGSSPTHDIPNFLMKGLKAIGPKVGSGSTANSGSPVGFNRSNSTGSTSSGHSSGRSTPVNVIPTPWVVPKSHAPVTNAGYTLTPNQYSSVPPSHMSSGMVYSPINSSYYHPTAGAGHHGLLTAPGGILHFTAMPNGRQISPRESYPPLNDNAYTQGTIPGLTGAGNRINQTSPNVVYPLHSTNDFYQINTPDVTTSTGSSRTSPASVCPLTSGAQEVCLDPTYYSLASNHSSHSGQMHHPVSTVGDKSAYYVTTNPPQFDTRSQTLPAGSSHVPGAVILPSPYSTVTGNETQRLPVNAGFVPINPLTMVNRPDTEQTYVSTSSEALIPAIPNQVVRPGVPSPEEYQRPIFSGIGPVSTASRQPIANDEYLKACLSQQRKRFQNLRKEVNIEKERLEILIKEISNRDHDLYDLRYLVAPNPTNEQIQQLLKENDHLKRAIEEISKNIDKVENGQDVLRPPDPRLHTPHRIVSSPRPKEPFDRSNSVPCLPASIDNGQKPPLGRPLSEHDLNINLDQRTVQYRLTPPSDSSLEDWSLVNREINCILPDPNVGPTHNDEGAQWSCSKCTFLNHGSLLVCEICGTNR